jgi:hypothetical protein
LGLFQDPATNLVTSFGIEIDEDPWFSDPRHERAVEDFTTTLANRPLEYGRERKRRGSARVDAAVMLWLDEKVASGERHWLVTLDRSLPGAVPKGSSARSLAILFPALLLWISPYTSNDTDDCVPEAFVRLLAERLLPPERIFALNDFRILQDMGVQVHSMPPDDVRDLIMVLRSTAGGLDTTDAADREKLAHEIDKFLVDPARRQHQELVRLSEENRAAQSENARLKEEQERTRVTTDSKLREMEDQQEKDRREFQGQLQAMREAAEMERETTKENERRRALQSSAYRRLALISLLLAMVLVATAWAVISWLPGQGRMQNIVDAWPLFSISAVLVLALGWLILGRERLAMLPWAVGKLFRIDEK